MVKEVEAATGFDAVTAAMKDGLSVLSRTRSAIRMGSAMQRRGRRIVMPPIWSSRFGRPAGAGHELLPELRLSGTCSRVLTEDRAASLSRVSLHRPGPCYASAPRSITMRHNFQWPPAKILMWANAGWDCQMHKKRAKATGGRHEPRRQLEEAGPSR